VHLAAGKREIRDLELRDDGLHGDREADDGVFTAVSPVLPPDTLVSHWVELTGASGMVACEPAAGGGRPAHLRTPKAP
jgi:hypothetical protein